MRSNRKILPILCSVWISSVALMIIGIAYTGGIRGVDLVVLSLFLTFAISVFMAQLIPGGMLLSSLAGIMLVCLKRTNDLSGQHNAITPRSEVFQ